MLRRGRCLPDVCVAIRRIAPVDAPQTVARVKPWRRWRVKRPASAKTTSACDSGWSSSRPAPMLPDPT
jgi:hypothetical protein